MTISDIAKMAGVSSAAVSRYLNGGPLSEQKRAVIHEVVEKTGYRPDTAAQTLRTGKVNQVGVIAPSIGSQSVGQITAGIASELDAKSYLMLLGNTELDAQRELGYLTAMQRNHVAGIILLGSYYTPQLAQALKNCRVPVVVTGQRFQDVACVYNDDRTAARELAQRMLDHGRRRIVYIGGTERDDATGVQRREGVQDALNAAGLNGEQMPRICCNAFTMEEGQRCMQELLVRCPDLDGVVCVTDTVAFGAMRALREAGRHVGAGCGSCRRWRQLGWQHDGTGAGNGALLPEAGGAGGCPDPAADAGRKWEQRACASGDAGLSDRGARLPLMIKDKSMGRKLIFLDIDGTLLPPGDMLIPESTLAALDRARANGHKLFLCTGRNHRMTEPLLRHDCFAGAVCSAGGYVLCDGKTLVDIPMEPQQAEGVRAALERNGVECTLEARDATFGGSKMAERWNFIHKKNDAPLNSEAERWRKAMEEGMSILPLSDYKGEPLYKIVFIADHESDLAEAKQLYADQFVFCESKLDSLTDGFVNGELINRKFDKGTGIKAICDHLGCTLADTIGFGDSDNDLQMTDVVGISVCMANGSENLKKRCDRIAPSVYEDGIAKEFKALGLI